MERLFQSQSFDAASSSSVSDDPAGQDESNEGVTQMNAILAQATINNRSESNTVSRRSSAQLQMEDVFTEAYYQSSKNPGDHGKKYEQDLAYMMFVRCSLEGCKFKLATEMVEGGKFDDVVLSFSDWKEVWLIQAKHAETTNHVKCKDLFPDDTRKEGNDFDLYKYIGSYFYVEQKLKSHPKKYFIFTNKSLEEDDLLKEWVDIATPNVNSLMDFSKIGGIYKRFMPKEDKINTIKDRLNQKFIDIKYAIIKLFQEGKIERILLDYKSPLQAILEASGNCIKFREEFSEHCGDISQRELFKALHAHFQDIKSKQTPKIETKKAINDLLNERSREQQLPPFVDETTVKEFFDRLTFCFNQPDVLSTIIDNDLCLYLCRWTLHRLRPNDLGKSDADQSVQHRRKFDDTFQKWVATKDDNKGQQKGKEGEKSEMKKGVKSFLSNVTGETCIKLIKDQLKQYESNHFNAVYCYYVNRSIEVHESESKGQKTLRISDNSLLEQLENNFSNNKCSSSILIAEPGMGKTTLLQYVGVEMQNRFKRDVFLIYLKSLDKHLQKVNSIDDEALVSNAFKDVLTETSLQILLSDLKGSKNRVLLLFDGFDEIDESSKRIAIALFRKLLDTGKNQLIISGRKHIQELLVRQLKLKVMSLVPLEEDEQMQFLRLFWNIPIIGSDKNKNEKFVKFSTRLLKKFHLDIGRWNYDFTGLPLMIRMLAEIHCNRLQKFLQSESTDLNEMFSSERFSVLKVFDDFVAKSFCMTVKKQSLNEIDYDIIERYPKYHIIHNAFGPFIIQHQWLAIKTLEVEQLVNVIEKKHSEIIAQLSELIKSGSEKSLLITFSSEDSPVEFNHLSYAEYFVAKYLYDNVDDCSEDLLPILNQYRVIRRFFFLMIGENFDKSANQMKIVDNICTTQNDVVFWACEASCVEVVKKLLEKRDFQTRTYSSGKSLLHVAAEVCCSELIQYFLVEHGVDVDSKDESGATPLHYASWNGHMEVFTMLINHSADVNAQSHYGKTPLHNAAEANQLGIAKMLMDRSANINVRNLFHKTPIHLAVERRHLEMVKMLVQRSANFNYQDHKYAAAEKGFLEIAKILIDLKESFDVLNETPLHMAVVTGHLEIVKMLIEGSTNVDVGNYNGTPLHYAVKHGQLEIAKMLIAWSANVDGHDKWKNTPLHLAAKAGNLEIARMLMDRSVNINAQNLFHKRPLHLAVENRHSEIAGMLIQQTANVNYQGIIYDAVSDGFLEIAKVLVDQQATGRFYVTNETPLHLAVVTGHLKIAKMLIDQSKNVDVGKYIGTPLHYAAQHGQLEIAEMLIERSANVNLRNQWKNTPLHLAVKAGNIEIARMLMDRSVNVNAPGDYNETPLHLAVTKGNLEITKMLIDRSANVNAQSITNFTPLHLAVKKGNLEIAKMLLNRSADVHAQTNTKSTPLHFAAVEGHLEIALMLIDWSAMVDIWDEWGHTPLDLAYEYGHLKIVKMLIERSGDLNAQNYVNGPVLVYISDLQRNA